MTKKKRHHPGGVDFQMEGPIFTRAVVLHVELRGHGKAADRDAESRLAEAVGLAQAIDLDIADSFSIFITVRKPATLIGSGKVEELARRIEETGAELVVVNGRLTPVQQRNLEKAWSAKVLDRTGLILEIFGRRATTREGALQVELAHLQYQKSRLVRSWTHLERQRGGFGFMGGPGERQIEADRRLIEERIARIETQLASVAKTRGLHRKGRARVPYPVAALVGYTNAGKSTLFNRLSGASVLAKDLLFATLDPTMRTIRLPHGRKIIVSDTVGFISDLPTSLIAAFRATLEEVLMADIIIHVRDISHPETDAQAEDVNRVLAELGIDELRRGNIVEVWNKLDLLSAEQRAARAAQAARKPGCVLLSAAKGEGIDQLLELIEERLGRDQPIYEVFIDSADGAGQAWLHRHGEILKRKTYQDGRIRFTLRLAVDKAGQAAARFGKAIRMAGPERRLAAE